MLGTPPAAIAAVRRMHARLAGGFAPSPGDLETPWEAYQAALRRAGASNKIDLPHDLVLELKADHDALVRSLRARAVPTCGVGMGAEIDGRTGDPGPMMGRCW
ncbi:MAG: hypothetical protein ACR2QO_25355 [Acidimicrobiales bacterium]